MTSWVTPERRFSIPSAASAEAGLPRISPPTTTIVSTPSTRRSGRARAPARAFARAFARATSCGTPRPGSPPPAGTPSKAMPSWSRIARRWGERLARIRASGRTLRRPDRGDSVAEEEGDLALGGLVGVRAVDEVTAHLEREVAADRAG